MIIDEHAKIVLVTTSGESYTIPESGIVKNTLSTSHSCSNSGGIPAGSCNAGTLSVSIRRPYGLQYRSLFGAKLRLYVWYGSHSEEQRGVYTLTSVTRSGNVLNISASDNIQLLDSSCYGAQDVQDAINGLLAILGSGNHTPAYIFNTICNAYSIPHLTQAENIEIIPEAGNISPGNLSTTIPQESPTESIRDFAQALAEYVGGFICAYEDGRLGFCRLGARVSDIVLDSTNIGMGTFQRAPYFVVPDRWRVTFDSGFWSGWEVTSDLPEGAAPLTMEVQNNLFWQAIEDTTPGEFLAGKVTEMVKHPWQYLRDAAQKDGVYRIHPFSATVYVPHLFRAGDLVTIKDPETGEKFQSYITDVTWSFKRGQNISCAGSDTRTLSVQKSRNSAKKSNDYSKYLYRKTKSGSGGGDTVSITRYQTSGTKIATFTVSGTPYDVYAPSSPTASQIQQWTEAAGKAHTHSNKAVLDATTAAYTVEEKEKLAGLHGRYLPLAGGTMDEDAGIKLKSKNFDSGVYTDIGAYIGGNRGEVQTHHTYTKGGKIVGFRSILMGDGLHLEMGTTSPPATRPSGTWFETSDSNSQMFLGTFFDDKIGIYEMHYESSEPVYTELITFDKYPGDIEIANNLTVNKKITAQSFSGANVTQSTQGLMSATDKKKLDGIAEGANKITVDTALSSTSTNPVQNKAICSASGVSTLINQLPIGTATPADADYYICQYAGGGTTTTTYHRRPMSALWAYIKSKISSILGLTASTYGGNAASATKVQSKVTKPTAQTTYYPDFHTGLSDEIKDLLHSGGNRLVLIEGTASTEGLAIHVLGDSTKSGTAGNKTGVMRLYGYSGFYGQFKPATNLSANRTYTLPNKSGTLVVASDLPVDSGWKNCTLSSFAASGTVKYRTVGKQISFYGEAIKLSKNVTSSPNAPQAIAYCDVSFENIKEAYGIGRFGAYTAIVRLTRYMTDNIVEILGMGSTIPSGTTGYFSITGFID